MDLAPLVLCIIVTDLVRIAKSLFGEFEHPFVHHRLHADLILSVAGYLRHTFAHAK